MEFELQWPRGRGNEQEQHTSLFHDAYSHLFGAKAPPAPVEQPKAEPNLPELILEVGKKHFKSLDSDRNGYVSRDELRSAMRSPKAATYTADEKRAFAEMDSKYEQIERSHKDEWWYKDRKGITVKDLTSYAAAQRHNRQDVIPATPGDHDFHVTIGGIKRDGTVHIPPGYKPDGKTPVVYALHYFSGNPKKMADYTHLNEKADRESFIVVYPAAKGWVGNWLRQWNLNNKPNYRVDELAFMSQLMDKVDRDLKPDADRNYVLGYSNGGMLAQEVAAKLGNRIAAFACVSGCKTGELKATSDGPSGLLIHGTEDNLVPYKGRWFTPLFPKMQPFTVSRDFWKSCLGAEKTDCCDVKDGVQKETFRNPQTGKEVVTYTLKGNGHGWPGHPESIDGNPCMKVDGANLVWDFFSKHRRNQK